MKDANTGGACYFSRISGSSYASDTSITPPTASSYDCGCAPSSGTACWAPDSTCPTGSSPGASPNVCTVQQSGNSAKALGWLVSCLLRACWGWRASRP